jgi:DNA-binding NarL/FixJ family response regulator
MAQCLKDIDMPQSAEIKVLIAHSNALISAGLSAILGKHRGFRVVAGRVALSAPPEESRSPFAPDVVVADYDSGLQLAVSNCSSSYRVVILTHSDSEAKICHALEQGARGYLLLDCGLQDLLDSVRSVHAGGIALAPLVASRVADRMQHEPLTSRELEVLRHMMLGQSNKRIALELALSVGTVKAHVKAILRKLDATSRTEAVAVARRRGLLDEERDPSRRSARQLRIRSSDRHAQHIPSSTRLAAVLPLGAAHG